MKKPIYIALFFALLSLVTTSCDNLWRIENTTDIAFSLNIDSLKKAIASQSNTREISSDNVNKITISLRYADTQEKVAEKTLSFNEDNTENLDITFNQLAIVGKRVFAEARLEAGGNISVGRSEAKKMVRGINVLHITELNSLSSITMVSVLAGSFERDSDGKTPFITNQTVTLSGFEIGETEVTQKQWLNVMGVWPSDKNPTEALGAGDEFPIYYATWYDAVRFCNKLTELEMGEEHQVYTINGDNVTQDISKKGYRLPTESEWEYAAGINPSGDRFTYAGTNNDTNSLEEYAWYGSSSGQTHEVKGKEKNLLNLYDMNGNVSEWCWDWHNVNGYYGGVQINPEGYSFGSDKILRGGSFASNIDTLSVSWRTYDVPTKNSTATIGFRLARSE